MKEISLKIIAYVLGALALDVYVFIVYGLVFIVNIIVMTIALYAASSIVVGRELKPLWNAFVISSLTIVISGLCFSFLHQFIALLISLFVLLVMIRYSLIKGHDSGWFGALCAEVIGLIFLSVIELVLGIANLFLF